MSKMNDFEEELTKDKNQMYDKYSERLEKAFIYVMVTAAVTILVGCGFPGSWVAPAGMILFIVNFVVFIIHAAKVDLAKVLVERLSKKEKR